MKISTKGRYALRVMIDLAENSTEKNVSIREISERQGVSEKYLEGIVAKLNQARLVKSVRGKYGGYRLTRKTTDYSILEILTATEETMSVVACLEEGAYCERASFCRTVGFWAGLQNYVHDYLRRVTLQDVMDGTYEVLPAHAETKSE